MKRVQIFFLFVISFVFTINGAIAQDASTLLHNMDNLMSAPKDKQATVKITLTNSSGKVKVREAMMKQKGKDKKLYRYTKPESQAGIATLSLPDNVMWLYLPAIGRPTKISLLSKSQAFTGTDFSYEDMESKPYSERYTPTLLESDKPDMYVLELVPISKKSKYAKIVLTLDKTNFYPLKMDFYNSRGDKFKEATYKYAKQGDYWYAKELLMTDLKKEHSTAIEMTDVKFDQGLPDDEFTVEYLKQ
ncbi:MAG: outer membrane lipoprotein-sorting protein [Chlorobi bacterium]|nr:outer membrane lipoprotein-sorting protein [Chlorobiota bacterium]